MQIQTYALWNCTAADASFFVDASCHANVSLLVVASTKCFPLFLDNETLLPFKNIALCCLCSVECTTGEDSCSESWFFARVNDYPAWHGDSSFVGLQIDCNCDHYVHCAVVFRLMHQGHC